MYRLFIHEDAERDLEALWDTEPFAAARIAALLEGIGADQDLMDRLTQHDYGAYATAPFHVSRWQSQWNRGKDLWRLKDWDLEAQGLQYRIPYAYMRGKQHYHVLGVLHRGQVNYDDPNHPITRRILRAYDEL